jgi:ribosome biogenesis GTPase A
MGLDEMRKEAALHRNALKKGGEPDTDKAVSFILEDFRSGRIGRITLEEPPEAP